MMNFKNNVARLAMIPLLSAVLPPVAQAVTPRAMLEKSATYALDNRVRAFRVPIQNSTGVIKFYDVTIDLVVLANGTLDPFADVTATLSPSVTTGVIAPGTYRSVDTLTTCRVTNITLTNGRIQSFLDCTFNTSQFSNVSVATGSISAGHPFQTQLVAAGLHTRPDANTFTWGLTTNGTFRVGNCGNVSAGFPIGAKTNGSQLILSLFNSSGAFLCSGTLIKQ